MSNSKYQKIVFAKKEEETKEDFFNKIGEQLKLLLDSGYIAVVRYEEPGLGIVVIEYEHDDNLVYWGCAQPMWVTPEEGEGIILIRENKKDE